MKQVYRYDPQTLKDNGSYMADDDYQLKSNETFTKTPNGGYPPFTYVRETDSWKDSGEEGRKRVEAEMQKQHEEYLAKHPELTQPSDTQKMLNMLGQQVAQSNQSNQQMKSMINMLGQQVAKLSQGKTGD